MSFTHKRPPTGWLWGQCPSCLTPTPVRAHQEPPTSSLKNTTGYTSIITHGHTHPHTHPPTELHVFVTAWPLPTNGSIPNLQVELEKRPFNRHFLLPLLTAHTHTRIHTRLHRQLLSLLQLLWGPFWHVLADTRHFPNAISSSADVHTHTHTLPQERSRSTTLLKLRLFWVLWPPVREKIDIWSKTGLFLQPI